MEQNYLCEIRNNASLAVKELLEKSHLRQGDILVVGCSSSEVAGKQIGTCSSMEAAQAVFEGIYSVILENELCLAVQCCEHLNRAVIIEKAVAVRERIPFVNVVPQPKAGGSFAVMAYSSFKEPAAIEHIRAQAGMDIGDTLIGMHLQEVAVPVRISIGRIGEAHLVCARTRPKFIGGERAAYNKELL